MNVTSAVIVAQKNLHKMKVKCRLVNIMNEVTTNIDNGRSPLDNAVSSLGRKARKKKNITYDFLRIPTSST